MRYVAQQDRRIVPSFEAAENEQVTQIEATARQATASCGIEYRGGHPIGQSVEHDLVEMLHGLKNNTCCGVSLMLLAICCGAACMSDPTRTAGMRPLKETLALAGEFAFKESLES